MPVASALSQAAAPDPSREACALRDQAARCRRLSRGATDGDVIAMLNLMALEYDAKAGALDRPH